jgi:glutamate--cysteine ligase
MPETAGLTTRAAAEAYIGGVCFKQGPPALVGAELEWLTERVDDDCLGERVDLAEMAAALGPYAPTSIAPTSPARPLPRGSCVSIEPGGQIELSSAPRDDVEQLCLDLAADAESLRRLLATRSLRMIPAAADARRAARRLLDLPRYRAMEARFARIGGFGALMMCNTAATQVSVDAGADAHDVAARWRALNAMGPALVAAFACSPRLAGAPPQRWASQRMRTWLHLDPARTDVDAWTDPIAEYAAWALDAPLLCVRRADGADWHAPPGASFADWLAGTLDDEIGRRPEPADLDYHLTTLFPPVRACGHLEVRYLDAQPEWAWRTPIQAVAALTSGPQVVAEAARLAAPTAGQWPAAARDGLRDPQWRQVAADLLDLAASAADSPRAKEELDTVAVRCRRGHGPHEHEEPKP